MPSDVAGARARSRRPSPRERLLRRPTSAAGCVTFSGNWPPRPGPPIRACSPARSTCSTTARCWPRAWTATPGSPRRPGRRPRPCWTRPWPAGPAAATGGSTSPCRQASSIFEQVQKREGGSLARGTTRSVRPKDFHPERTRCFLPGPGLPPSPPGRWPNGTGPWNDPYLTSSPVTRRGFQLLASGQGGKQLRFAVHGPGLPVASPRSHGVPRRDVPGRVHVRVACVSAGGAPEDGLALARPRVHLPARRAALAA